MTRTISGSSSRRRTRLSWRIFDPSCASLMAVVARDLDTRLDWVATDLWNTDNPHVHVVIRGKAEDGQDLFISQAYTSRGFRDCAALRVTLELGPRTELEIRSALDKEVEAERWTGLDRALRNIADENGGVADLYPGAAVRELRRLMLGRPKNLNGWNSPSRSARPS
jgi:type IV secretory pathway VirD2 relaxase